MGQNCTLREFGIVTRIQRLSESDEPKIPCKAGREFFSAGRNAKSMAAKFMKRSVPLWPTKDLTLPLPAQRDFHVQQDLKSE